MDGNVAPGLAGALTEDGVLDPNDFKTEPLQRVAAYWLSKARAGRLPRRADIKPDEIARDLPFVYLVDIELNPLAFRYRLVGTAICEWAARDHTGVAINEAEYGPYWASIFNDYRSVMETGRPARIERPGPWITRDFFYYERFLAPLANDGLTVDMIFGALHIIKR